MLEAVKDEPKKKEPTAREKLQIEYNQLITLFGHNAIQMKNLQKTNDEIEEKIQKILKKNQNLPKEEGTKDDSNG